MLDIFGKAIIAFIESELIKSEPEIEELMIDKLKELMSMLAAYLNEKTQKDK